MYLFNKFKGYTRNFRTVKFTNIVIKLFSKNLLLSII